jgi:hypothetical protein
VHDVIETARRNLNDEEFEDLIAEYRRFCYGQRELRTDQLSISLHTRVRLLANPPTPRRLPLAKLTEVKNMLEDMERRGVIEEADSLWSGRRMGNSDSA